MEVLSRHQRRVYWWITGVSMLAGLTIGAAVGIGVSKKIHKKLSPVKKGAIMALDILGKTMSDVSQSIN